MKCRQVNSQRNIEIVARQILFASQQEDENIKETMLSQYVDVDKLVIVLRIPIDY